jgi:hypothetical protein
MKYWVLVGRVDELLKKVMVDEGSFPQATQKSCPLKTVDCASALNVASGKDCTVMVWVDVLEHPLAPVTVRVTLNVPLLAKPDPTKLC